MTGRQYFGEKCTRVRLALTVKWAGIDWSLAACDALDLQSCNLAARSVALPQYLKLIECFLHVSSMTHKEGKHVVSVLKQCVSTKRLFSALFQRDKILQSVYVRSEIILIIRASKDTFCHLWDAVSSIISLCSVSHRIL